MRKLVISLDSYYWVRFVSGTIIQDPSEYELVIVYKDLRNIFWMRNLCADAIYEQRKYDVFQIGTELGIKRANNLRYDYEGINLEKFSAELHLYIMLNNIKEIYLQNNIILNRIFGELKKKYDLKLFVYGNCDAEEIKKVKLTKQEYLKKLELKKLMVGINNKAEKDLNFPIERFYEVE